MTRPTLLFADVAMAAEIDRAEGGLCAQICKRTAQRRPEKRAIARSIAGGVAAYAGPGAPSNKVIGIGLGQPLDESRLAAIEEEYRDRNEPVRIELATLADAMIPALLTARGYRLVGFENVLGHPLDLEAPSVPQLPIEIVEAQDEAEWLDVIVDGFASPDPGPGPMETYPREALEQTFTDFGSTTGFVRYLARVEGKPAGAASVRIAGKLAQMCGAATLPVFRRRGIQTALLERRLMDARAAKCKLAVVTTQPGSKSQANSQRRGFQLLYTRAILIREW